MIDPSCFSAFNLSRFYHTVFVNAIAIIQEQIITLHDVCLILLLRSKLKSPFYEFTTSGNAVVSHLILAGVFKVCTCQRGSVLHHLFNVGLKSQWRIADFEDFKLGVRWLQAGIHLVS